MASVQFVLPGRPKGKSVARVTRFGSFTPAATREEMETLRRIARDAMGGRAPFTGPVELRMCAYMPVPAGFRKAEREAALAGLTLPTIKPDGSNIQKLIEDAIQPPPVPRSKAKVGARARAFPPTALQHALNKVVIVDDTQIVRWQGWKLYSDDPRVVVEITEIELGAPE